MAILSVAMLAGIVTSDSCVERSALGARLGRPCAGLEVDGERLCGQLDANHHAFGESRSHYAWNAHALYQQLDGDWIRIAATTAIIAKAANVDGQLVVMDTSGSITAFDGRRLAPAPSLDAERVASFVVDTVPAPAECIDTGDATLEVSWVRLRNEDSVCSDGGPFADWNGLSITWQGEEAWLSFDEGVGVSWPPSVRTKLVHALAPSPTYARSAAPDIARIRWSCAGTPKRVGSLSLRGEPAAHVGAILRALGA